MWRFPEGENPPLTILFTPGEELGSPCLLGRAAAIRPRAWASQRAPPSPLSLTGPLFPFCLTAPSAATGGRGGPSACSRLWEKILSLSRSAFSLTTRSPHLLFHINSVTRPGLCFPGAHGPDGEDTRTSTHQLGDRTSPGRAILQQV